MKKLIIISAILTSNFQLLTLICCAQPNGGFENWNLQYSYENPNGWQTLNFLSVIHPSNTVSVFKATGIDKHSGNYALKLKTVFVSSNPAPGGIDDTIGRIFTGKIIISPPSIQYGIPYTGRPEKLEFWCKYTPVGNDTGGAAVILSRWNGTGRDSIAAGLSLITATTTYTKYSVDLTYNSTALPDTIVIAFASSYLKIRARVGSTLYLDDVALTGWVGIDEHIVSDEKVQLFPNPSKDYVNIFAQIEEAEDIQVVDASGRAMGQYKIQNYKANVNTSAFAEGIYLYDIRDKKNKILSKGKFNVVK